MVITLKVIVITDNLGSFHITPARGLRWRAVILTPSVLSQRKISGCEMYYCIHYFQTLTTSTPPYSLSQDLSYVLAVPWATGFPNTQKKSWE